MSSVTQRRVSEAIRPAKGSRRRAAEAPVRKLRAQKSERLVARVSMEDKAIISQAAALAGQSVGSYILSEARKAAFQTLDARQRIVLNAAQTQRLVELLLAPVQQPGARAKRALKAYRQTVVSDVNF